MRLTVFTATAISALALAFSSQAGTFVYQANLSGPAEFPPNASPGTGFATVIYDDLAHTLSVEAFFTGLIGNTTAAHIHAPTDVPFAGGAGVATQTPSFVGFPLGVTSGSFNNTYDLTQAASFRAAYITANGGTPAGAEAALAAALAQGKAYFNIHTTQFGGGEIRGFLAVPDSGTTFALMGLGLMGLGLVRRKLN